MRSAILLKNKALRIYFKVGITPSPKLYTNPEML